MKSNKNIIALLAIMVTFSVIASDYVSYEDTQETTVLDNGMDEQEETEITEDSTEE